MAMKKFKVTGPCCSISPGREMGLTNDQAKARQQFISSVKGKTGVYVSSRVEVFEFGDEVELNSRIGRPEFFKTAGLTPVEPKAAG